MLRYIEDEAWLLRGCCVGCAWVVRGLCGVECMSRFVLYVACELKEIIFSTLESQTNAHNIFLPLANNEIILGV